MSLPAQLHARWATASEVELQRAISGLQGSVERSEAQVLPRSRTSLAASQRQTLSETASESNATNSAVTAGSPPPDAQKINTFLTEKAALLEMFALFTARRHLEAIKVLATAAEDNPTEKCIYEHAMATLKESANRRLVCGPCTAYLGVHGENASLDVEDATLPPSLLSDSVNADPITSAHNKENTPDLPLPQLLRLPLSEDDELAFHLDLWVTVPAAAFARVKALIAHESLHHSSLSLSPDLSVWSGDRVESESGAKASSGHADRAGGAGATCTSTHATGEHFLWTMLQVPFTLSYLYGANDISSSTTRTAYATLVSSAPHCGGRSHKAPHAGGSRSAAAAVTVPSDGDAPTSLAGRSQSRSSSACPVSPSLLTSDDDEDEEASDSIVDCAKGGFAHPPRGGPRAVPLAREATCSPQDVRVMDTQRCRRRSSSARSGGDSSVSLGGADTAETLVSVRLRIDFPSVRFAAKPESLSLHSFLIAQPPTRYGPSVQSVVLVDVLPPPTVQFRPTLSPHFTQSFADATTSAPMADSGVNVMPVPAREGTARGYVIVHAADLLHSVDFSVRCGDGRVARRPFIVYSKEFLSDELGQYLLPWSCSTNTATTMWTGVKDNAAGILAECACGEDEWAIPIILPYKLPHDALEMDVTFHLDVRFRCQPNRSFRKTIPLTLVTSTAAATARASSPPAQQAVSPVQTPVIAAAAGHARSQHKAVAAKSEKNATSTPLAHLPPCLLMPDALQQPRSPTLIRSRLPSTLFPATPQFSDVDVAAISGGDGGGGVPPHLRLSPQLHITGNKLISTSRVRVASFAICDGGALVICAERVAAHRSRGPSSGSASLQPSPGAPSLSTTSRPRRRRTYRSFLGFSPTNAMNSCFPIDSNVAVPPAMTAHLVEAAPHLARFLRPDTARVSNTHSVTSTPHADAVQAPPQGWQTLDIRYLMAKGWVFDARLGEPRAHNTVVLGDKTTGECLVVRVSTDYLEEQMVTRHRESLSLPPDDPLCSPHASGANLSHHASGAQGPLMEVILYVPPQIPPTAVAEQQFVTDSLAVLTRTKAADLLWWSRTAPANVVATPTTARGDQLLLSGCHVCQLWELENEDGLTLLVVVLGAQCVISEDGSVVSTTASRENESATRTVGVYCLEERRLLYHFEVLVAEFPVTEETPQRSPEGSRSAGSRRTVRTCPVPAGVGIVSREEATGAVVYWDAEKIVVVVCSPSWSHHEVFHVSTVVIDGDGSASLRAEGPLGPEGVPLSTDQEPSSTASRMPFIVAVTTTATPPSLQAPNVEAEEVGGDVSGHETEDWMAFALLSDGHIIGLKRACLNAPTTTALEAPRSLAIVVGAVFNPGFVHPYPRVRDIVLCYYAIESQVRRRWSPLRSYTSAPGGGSSGAFDAAVPETDTAAVEAASGPIGVLYLYGVEAETNRLLKDAVVIDA